MEKEINFYKAGSGFFALLFLDKETDTAIGIDFKAPYSDICPTEYLFSYTSVERFSERDYIILEDAEEVVKELMMILSKIQIEIERRELIKKQVLELLNKKSRLFNGLGDNFLNPIKNHFF